MEPEFLYILWATLEHLEFFKPPPVNIQAPPILGGLDIFKPLQVISMPPKILGAWI